jgi:multidrug resistance efflux pump
MIKNRWRKTIISVAVAVVACGAVPLVWPGLLKETATAIREPVVRPVNVMRLEDPAAAMWRQFPGAAEATRRTNLAFRVGGPLRSYDVDVGELIEEGDLLAEIDPRDYEVAVRSIEAALAEANATLKAMRSGARTEDIQALRARIAAAQASLSEAELQFQRHKNLYEQNAVSQAAFDHAKAAFEMAAAKVEGLKQELQKAQTGARAEDIEAMEEQIARLEADRDAALNALEDTKLIAPFTGYVARKFAENYETVQAGQPIVAFLDCSKLEVTVGLPEEMVIQADRFDRFECEFDAVPGQRFEARLEELGRSSRDAGQTYPLTVSLTPPPDAPIRPGMAATVYIHVAQAEAPLFLAPVEALEAGLEGEWRAWVYEPASRRVYPREVTVGELTSSGIEVLSGLKPGEWIVTAGVDYLDTGQEVKPLDPAAPAP